MEGLEREREGQDFTMGGKKGASDKQRGGVYEL